MANELKQTLTNVDEEEDKEPIELILFQVPESYVYLIPPRKSAASYRADEWNVNKWAWEGALKVVSKGEECIIRLEDKTTGELYARAFLRDGEPHPVEAVIDSSRYFVLRIEENIGKYKQPLLNREIRKALDLPDSFSSNGHIICGRLRHAFIGIGFRERTEAYDFQAALHDHMKYLNKKKEAEEMEQQYKNTSSVDYSLKDGETIVLQLKNNSGRDCGSKVFEQGMNNLSLEEKGKRQEPLLAIKPPPPPPSPLSPVAGPGKSPPISPSKLSLNEASENKGSSFPEEKSKEPKPAEDKISQDIPDDDFGDFQAA